MTSDNSELPTASQPKSTTTTPLPVTPVSTLPAMAGTGPASQPAAMPAKASEKDLMDGLTRWVVLGDNGLMEHFQEHLITGLLQDVFVRFQKDEAERKKKEADEKSWAEALNFRRYNLRLKFFYRWRKNARQAALSRRARTGREKMRAYREAKFAEEKAAKEEAAKRKAREEAAASFRSSVDSSRALAAQFRERATSGAQSRLEESRRRSSGAAALHATGVLAGLRNESEAITQIVPGNEYGSFANSRPSSSQSMPVQRATSSKITKSIKRNPLTESFMKLKASGMENSKRAKLYLKHIGLQSSNASSRASSPSSIVAKTDLSKSVPSVFKRSTNFDNSAWRRSSADLEREPKPHQSALKSDYWRLRARV